MRVLFASCLLSLAANAGAAAWHSIDGSSLTFETTFEGEALPGEFRSFEVRLEFDPQAPQQARLAVTVDLAAADMGDPDMNEVLFDTAWLDVRRFGVATFNSDRISETAPGEYLATGTLDLKGTQRSVSVPFSWQSAGNSAALRGQLSLRRSDFDVGSGEWANGDSIGLDVSLHFDVRLAADE